MLFRWASRQITVISFRRRDVLISWNSSLFPWSVFCVELGNCRRLKWKCWLTAFRERRASCSHGCRKVQGGQTSVAAGACFNLSSLSALFTCASLMMSLAVCISRKHAVGQLCRHFHFYKKEADVKKTGNLLHLGSTHSFGNSSLLL